MSTRSNLLAVDQYHRVQIYRHCDGSPRRVLPDLLEALEYAWPTPRFQASDFLAAVIRAWKHEGGGNIYIDGSPKAWERIHGDTEWVYEISGTSEGIGVKVYDWHHYWLETVNIDAKDFRPSPVRTVDIRPTTTREELTRIGEEIERA